jgi:serine/threonine-protein phosphatase 2A regulatory subunit B
MSADDLRVNMWHLDNDILAYNVVDLKPSVLEDLQEVITHMEHHPSRSELFLFSSSKGYVATCDLRMNSRFDKRGKNVAIFMTEDEPSKKNFFTDIVNSVAKAKFSPIQEDPYIFSRDYLAVHVWDIRNTRTPARSLNVTDYIEKKLCDVYESEAIFDKFDLHVSPDASMVLTGSYNSNAHVLDLVNQTNWAIDVKFMDKRGKNVGLMRKYRGRRLLAHQPTNK